MTIAQITQAITPARKQLLNHALYSKINTPKELNAFLQTHVYAVWDFMSLLKALQIKLTCTQTPWVPIGNPQTRYLINEIVLAEETDLAPNGSRQSHFEMYLSAMQQCGANTEPITSFLNQVIETQNILVAIKQSDLPPNVKSFLNFTFTLIEQGKPHQIAAAFTFGREDLIPSMFTEILKNLQAKFPKVDLSELVYYFERHIELDADDHGPMALQMVEELCENDSQKWAEVEEVSLQALAQRSLLWDAIAEEIEAAKLVEA